jgi:hypothetical protein
MSTLKVTNITPQSGSNVHLTGSLIISETLIAKEVRTELTQSVVLFQSGSTKFGDTSDDIHVFTGSLNITGSTTQKGEIDIKGKSNKVRFHFDTTASLPSATDYHGMFAHVHAEGAAYFAHGGNWVELANSSSFATDIAALDTASGSFSTRVTTNETEIDALQTDSGSFSTRVTTNETEIDALQTDSGSFSTRVTTNETEIDALQTDSGSFSTRITTNETDVSALQTFSSSLDATYATDAQLSSASSSLASDISTNLSSINTLGNDNTTQDSQIGSLITATGSYASTGSNTFTGETIISSSQLLTLQPIDPAPITASTGSLIVSGSPAVLYIWNGSWSAV